MCTALNEAERQVIAWAQGLVSRSVRCRGDVAGTCGGWKSCTTGPFPIPYLHLRRVVAQRLFAMQVGTGRLIFPPMSPCPSSSFPRLPRGVFLTLDAHTVDVDGRLPQGSSTVESPDRRHAEDL